MALVLRSALGQFSRSIREMQVAGSLEALFATPAPPVLLMAGSAAYTLVSSAFQATLLLVAGQVLFGADLSHANWPAAMLSLGLGVLAFGCVGLIGSAFVLVYKRGDPVAWAMDAATVLLSGVVFPVEVLPTPLRSLSLLLPATHALSALRQNLLFGAGPSQTVPELTALVVSTLAFAATAAVVLHLALRKAARDGTLSHA
jgi:ABC-2 type transport system permease protein